VSKLTEFCIPNHNHHNVHGYVLSVLHHKGNITAQISS